ncbi:tRNA-guanine transglycosylase family protein [Xylariomycetidae sp. FL0641]|nr:tRNA-guanine transglycosylase family protein [Xylariomycetidae sp. FL0641]
MSLANKMSSLDGKKRAIFSAIENVVAEGIGARTGRLTLPKRPEMETPNYIGLTSRGAVPHMTPDNLSKHIHMGGAYFALEDFLESSRKRPFPAIYNIPQTENGHLHSFSALPPRYVSVLGARRHPAVTAPMGNTQKAVSIYTSTGFQKLTTEIFERAVGILKPDIAIPLADMAYNASKSPLVAKRLIRMVDRTEDWLISFLKLPNPATQVFAPLLPIDYPTQWEYLNRLEQDYSDALGGLAVYDVDILPELEHHAPLLKLPRLSLDYAASPRQVLRQILLGVDVFTLPFLNSTSDAGVAMSFQFPAPTELDETPRTLGIDLWQANHQTSLAPLVEGCICYTCTKHHRAYLHHLLNAKEMLGWNLLQIHNHHVMSEFFKGIRDSLNNNPSGFEKECDRFALSYEADIPQGTGTRPRARGYNFKSQGGDTKLNRPVWEKYDEDGADDPALAAEMAGLAVTGATAMGNETPIIPDNDAKDLDEKGFGKIER